MDRYFEFKEITEEKQFKIVKFKLENNGRKMLKTTQENRVLCGKRKIDTWDKLKSKMCNKYIPIHYRQQLYVRMSTYRHLKKSMVEYAREFEALMLGLGLKNRRRQPYACLWLG